MRKVKCQFCEITDTVRSEMEFELVGIKRPVRKYYHKYCYGDFLKEKKFKEEEQREKDELVETIKDMYNVKDIPRQAFPLLESLRNGQPVFGNRQRTGKRYKEGYKYSLIKATFEYCGDTIEYYNNTKNFNGFMSAFKYGLAIVIDKIYIVEQREKERKSRDNLSKRREISRVNEDERFIVKSKEKEKEDEMDISDLL